MAKAAAPQVAAPQAVAENSEYKRMLKGLQLGAAQNPFLATTAGVNYLGSVAGTQTYSANALVSH